ncbi:MAG: zinc ABC transporter substrate-binding protein [Desulfobacteraceae bacterium]|nr:zinc ABC transporter substrate-binding protein [Desulfobacteraceae bacterium]
MKRIFTVIGTILLIAAAASAQAENSAPGLKVFVSIPPQKYFVKQIAGDRADIRVMVPPGAHPATYEPTPRQMTALAESDIYLAVGVPFESAWMDKIRKANPDLAIVHTDAWIEKQPIDPTASEKHAHGGKDPHIWLCPPLVMLQARHMVTAFIAADPQHAEFYNSRYRQFVSALDELDAKLRSLFPPGKKTPEFLVFHPSWGYFADAYGLKQIPVEKAGKSPKSAEIQRLIKHARQKKIQTVLVQPQVSSRAAEVIARAIDGSVVDADPLAANWRENLLSVAEKIRQAAR